MRPTRTGRWVTVADGEDSTRVSVRMMYLDRRDREVVRWNREWWLVRRTTGPCGTVRYVPVRRA